MTDCLLKINAKQPQGVTPITSDQIKWTEVTRRIAVGDQEAFALYYNTYFEPMYVIVRNVSGRDEQTCLDIVQEAMLKAIRHMKPMESTDHLTAWSQAVAKSAAYDWFRIQSRRTSLEAEKSKLDFKANEIELLNQQVLENEARLFWIEQQLNELPAELQKMISLRYRLGWTLQKIAAKFGVKTGAIDGRIRRAIAELKTKAKEEQA